MQHVEKKQKRVRGELNIELMKVNGKRLRYVMDNERIGNLEIAQTLFDRLPDDKKSSINAIAEKVSRCKHGSRLLDYEMVSSLCATHNYPHAFFYEPNDNLAEFYLKLHRILKGGDKSDNFRAFIEPYMLNLEATKIE